MTATHTPGPKRCFLDLTPLEANAVKQAIRIAQEDGSLSGWMAAPGARAYEKVVAAIAKAEGQP